MNDLWEKDRKPVTYHLLSATRLLILLLMCGMYYLDPGWEEWRYHYVLVAALVFALNHFLIRVVQRHFLWLLAIDFFFATGFGLVFLDGGNLYILFYGILSVTLMLMTDSKRVKMAAGMLFLLTLTGLLVAGQVYVGKPIHWLDLLINIGFVVFSVLVGSLIRHFQMSRLQTAQLYQELQDAHDQLHGYARQVEALTATRERNLIAREIHDTVGHTMTALLVQLQAARKLQERDLEKSRETLLRCEDLARSALQEVRLSVRAIRDEERVDVSIIESLRTLMTDFSEMSEMCTDLYVQGNPGVIGQSLQPTLFRIVQESLTNAKRHGNAGSASVTLTCTDEKITLDIRDDGAGTGEIAPSFGLINMRERVAEQGGAIQFSSQPGRGFCVSVTFPLQQQTWRFGGRGA